MNAVLSSINQIHTSINFFFIIHFNIILPTTSLFPRRLFCTDISTKITYIFFVFVVLWFFILILYIFRNQQKSVKGGERKGVFASGATPLGGVAQEKAKMTNLYKNAVLWAFKILNYIEGKSGNYFRSLRSS